MDFTVEGKLSWVWPGRLGTGMGLGKRNFLMKERKLFLPLWLFSIKWLILCGCEQTLCPSAPLPAQQHLQGQARRELCVSAHLALKSDSKINFLLLQQFSYYIKMPLQSSLLRVGWLHGFRKRKSQFKVNEPQFVVPVFRVCLIPPFCSFSSTHCSVEPGSSLIFAISAALVLKCCS